ncbi:MAG: hypothetical protein K0S08_46 [Gammaproteobacteria bacterium]|jgi:hypothetical protein|nr:hypothetical protein [Gammaproteobacteria bacterium]
MANFAEINKEYSSTLGLIESYLKDSQVFSALKAAITVDLTELKGQEKLQAYLRWAYTPIFKKFHECLDIKSRYVLFQGLFSQLLYISGHFQKAFFDCESHAMAATQKEAFALCTKFAREDRVKPKEREALLRQAIKTWRGLRGHVIHEKENICPTPEAARVSPR